jgi:hypothetical protein
VGAATVFRANAQDHDHGRADPVLAELKQQLTTAVRALAAGGGGEPARRIAAILRVADAAGISRQFDARLRAKVRRDGREATLLQTPDLDKFAAELKVFGIREPFALSPSTYEERARVLDAVKSACDRLEALASALDRSSIIPVAQATPDDPCWIPCTEVLALEFMVAIACLGTAIDFGVSCFFFTGMLIGLRLGYAMQGCLC